MEEVAQTGHFYQIKLHLVCEIHPTKCMESVAVLCTVGSDEMVVYNRNISTCPGNAISYGYLHTTYDTKQLKL